MSSVPRLTALTASELYFTVTESAVTEAKSAAGLAIELRLACSASLPSSLIRRARLPPDADAVKTDPSDKLTETLEATTSMRVVAGGPASVVLRNAKSPPMCTKSAKSAWKLIALKETTPALTLRGAVTPSMSSVPRFTALTASELYFTVTESAVTEAKSAAGLAIELRLACSASLPSSLIRSARLPPDADAVKTDPSDKLTETLEATTSMRVVAGGPASVVLRNAKSPPMCTKSAKSAWKLIALKETTPAPTLSGAVTPSMSSVPRLTALTASELYFTVTESAVTEAKSAAAMATELRLACSALLPSSLISSARLPLLAVAVKTEPSDRLTETLDATTSMRVDAGGPASVALRNAKSPPMWTKSAKSAWKLIALKETTPALTLRGAVTPSMSSVPRLTALTASELYFTVTESAVTEAKSAAVMATELRLACSALDRKSVV